MTSFHRTKWHIGRRQAPLMQTKNFRVICAFEKKAHEAKGRSFFSVRNDDEKQLLLARIGRKSRIKFALSVPVGMGNIPLL